LSGELGAQERGSATVEFALVIPIVLLVLFALVEVVVVGRVQIELLGAARQGARVAATNPDPGVAVDAVHAALGENLANEVIVTVERPAVVGREAVVSLSLTHRLASALFGGVPVDLAARSVMRVEL
jgi:Flp pilus assembly protein TadG